MIAFGRKLCPVHLQFPKVLFLNFKCMLFFSETFYKFFADSLLMIAQDGHLFVCLIVPLNLFLEREAGQVAFPQFLLQSG
jgi:hypothetical protein